MTPAERVKQAVESFEGITGSSCGDPKPDDDDPSWIHPGWVKFEIEKTELGWRVLEFLAWVTGDMLRAGERLKFFPSSPPPYLNEPGNCLSFVIEVHPKDGDQEERFTKVADFINQCKEEYWSECKPA